MTAFTSNSNHNIHFCDGAGAGVGTYTLEKRSPGGTEVLGNDISTAALAFDPSALTLTVSGSNAFESGGVTYNGDINLSLCHSSGLCSDEFILAYSELSCDSDTLSIDVG